MNLNHIYYIISNVPIVPVSHILSYFVFVVIRGTVKQTFRGMFSILEQLILCFLIVPSCFFKLFSHFVVIFHLIDHKWFEFFELMAGFHLQTFSTICASAGTLGFDMWPAFGHIAYRCQEEVVTC